MTMQGGGFGSQKRGAPRSPQVRTAGFSLIEALVVAAILSMVGGALTLYFTQSAKSYTTQKALDARGRLFQKAQTAMGSPRALLLSLRQTLADRPTNGTALMRCLNLQAPSTTGGEFTLDWSVRGTGNNCTSVAEKDLGDISKGIRISLTDSGGNVLTPVVDSLKNKNCPAEDEMDAAKGKGCLWSLRVSLMPICASGLTCSSPARVRILADIIPIEADDDVNKVRGSVNMLFNKGIYSQSSIRGITEDVGASALLSQVSRECPRDSLNPSVFDHFDNNGWPVCRTIAGTCSGPGMVFTGIASTGVPDCKPLACPAGQVVTGLKSDGTLTCN